MKKVSFIIAAFTAVAFIGCQKLENLQPTNESSNTDVNRVKSTNPKFSNFDGEEGPFYCGTPTEVRLLAGQHIEVGNVTVANDDFNIYVTYNLTASGWQFGTLHLYVGSQDEAPTTRNGSPIPGHFPYKADVNGSTTSYTFTIPVSSLPDCYIVAAHAEVTGRGNETAWGEGTRFVQKGNWGMFFNDCRDICGGEPGADEIIKPTTTTIKN